MASLLPPSKWRHMALAGQRVYTMHASMETGAMDGRRKDEVDLRNIWEEPWRQRTILEKKSYTKEAPAAVRVFHFMFICSLLHLPS